MKTFQTLALTGSAVTLGLFTACVPAPHIELTNETDLPSFRHKSIATNQSKTLNLSSIALRVRQNNPQLRAARLTINEAQGRITQAGRLANPTLGLGVKKTIPSSEGELEVSFSQRFPVTNKLALEKRVSKQALLIAQEEIKIAERELTTAAQLLAVEIVGLRSSKDNLTKQINSLKDIATFIESAAKRGELSPLDASQTKLEIQSLKIKKEQLDSQQMVLNSQLKSYIGLDPQRSLYVTGSLPPVNKPQSKLILTNRADYRAKVLEFNHAKSNILLEKAHRYEDLEMEVSASLGREEDAPEGLETEGALGFGISIPLPLYDKNEGNIKAATAKAKRHQLERSSIAKLIRNQVDTQQKTMNSWLKQNRSIRNTLLPMASRNAKQLEDIYRQGQGDFTDFLKAKKQSLEIKSQLIQNDIEFHKARVQYFSAIGKSNSVF